MMRNTIQILAILLLSLNVSHAQQKLIEQRGYIGISAGPSLPRGEFGSSDLSSPSSGAAETGTIFNISLGYRLGKFLGISAMLHGQTNDVDNNALENELIRLTGTSWTVSSKPWTIGGIMLGGFSSVPLNEESFFDMRLLVGLVNSTSPEIKTTLNASGGSAWVKQGSASASTFGYLLGGGFRYNAGNSLCLLFNIDYLWAEPTFSNIETTSSTGGAPLISSFKQKFGTINIGFGLGIRI